MTHKILKFGLTGAAIGAAGGITAAFALNVFAHAQMVSEGLPLPLALLSMLIGGAIIIHEPELGGRAMCYGAAVGGTIGTGIGIAGEIYSFFNRPVQPLGEVAAPQFRL